MRDSFHTWYIEKDLKPDSPGAARKIERIAKGAKSFQDMVEREYERREKRKYKHV